jgi:hypothetical protein
MLGLLEAESALTYRYPVLKGTNLPTYPLL